MSKRKVTFEDDIGGSSGQKSQKISESVKKHTLDSDEEDSGDDERYNILHEDDIEGEEDGVAGGDEDDVKYTAFNMKEELEEGHFDKDGHFQWNKEKEIKDNWLDNIDWHKIKKDHKYKEDNKTLGDDSSDSSEDEVGRPKPQFNEIETYKEIIKLMQPRETIKKTLQRLGGATQKLSSMERWRRKKAGIVDENSQLVTQLTELANLILTKLGNMDIYSETFEMIKSKIDKNTAKNSQASNNEELDMYADDFDVKEKHKIDEKEVETPIDIVEEDESKSAELMWEYKVKVEDDEILGPYNSMQMQKFAEDGKFGDGVMVRKVSDDKDAKFYTSNRIDFDLYI